MHSDIRELLGKKGHVVHGVLPDTTVFEAVKAMNEHGIGAVLVMEKDLPIGIFSERDVLRRILEPGRDARQTIVRDVMTTPLVTVTQRMTVADAMRLMTVRRLRHLPVVEDDRLVGLVSIGDLTKWVTRDLRDEVEQLESYINGPSL